jgi:hypothetical protein
MMINLLIGTYRGGVLLLFRPLGALPLASALPGVR